MGAIMGLRLKALREERDLTMDQVASDMNAKFNLNETDHPLNRSMISRWENDKNDPSLENAKYLSQYFDVSLDYLIGLTDKRTPSRLK